MASRVKVIGNSLWHKRQWSFGGHFSCSSYSWVRTQMWFFMQRPFVRWVPDRIWAFLPKRVSVCIVTFVVDCYASNNLFVKLIVTNPHCNVIEYFVMNLKIILTFLSYVSLWDSNCMMSLFFACFGFSNCYVFLVWHSFEVFGPILVWFSRVFSLTCFTFEGFLLLPDFIFEGCLPLLFYFWGLSPSLILFLRVVSFSCLIFEVFLPLLLVQLWVFFFHFPFKIGNALLGPMVIWSRVL